MGLGWEVDPTGPWGTGRVCRCTQKHKRTRVDPLTRGLFTFSLAGPVFVLFSLSY